MVTFFDIYLPSPASSNHTLIPPTGATFTATGQDAGQVSAWKKSDVRKNKEGVQVDGQAARAAAKPAGVRSLREPHPGGSCRPEGHGASYFSFPLVCFTSQTDTHRQNTSRFDRSSAPPPRPPILPGRDSQTHRAPEAHGTQDEPPWASNLVPVRRRVFQTHSAQVTCSPIPEEKFEPASFRFGRLQEHRTYTGCLHGDGTLGPSRESVRQVQSRGSHLAFFLRLVPPATGEAQHPRSMVTNAHEGLLSSSCLNVIKPPETCVQVTAPL